MGKNRLITDEKSIAKVFNDYFTSIIKHLHIERKEFDSKNVKLSNNAVLSAVNKFQNHPSVLKIKSNRTYSGEKGLPRNHGIVVNAFLVVFYEAPFFDTKLEFSLIRILQCNQVQTDII